MTVDAILTNYNILNIVFYEATGVTKDDTQNMLNWMLPCLSICNCGSFI